MDFVVICVIFLNKKKHMERNIIVTINNYPNFKSNEESIESFRNAATNWSCDFYEKKTHEDSKLPGKKFFWDKFWILNNFKEYDNVLYLDSDCVINSRSPSIFNEVENDYDLFVVLDGNPGRFSDDFFKNIYSKNFSNKANEHNIFINIFKKFNVETYVENYFNAGLMMFNPKRFSKHLESLNNTINSEEILKLFNNGLDDQNLLNAWVLESGVKIKYLDNTWNWIAPDISQEYETMFLKPMIPNIYHFCGTNLSKERLKTYNRWR
jgi:lipopolysaccharide biosynthesis glycosyltransferase